MSRLVGIFVCPRGVFGVECRTRPSGLEVVRSFDAHARLESAQEAVGQLGQALAENGIKRAEIALVIRGFGATHHVLAFPRATDSVLDAIVEREVRRLEPQMTDPVVAWTRLPAADAADAGEAGQTDVLAAVLPSDVAKEFAAAIQGAGHSLSHLTVLSSAMHRLAEEFVPAADTAALVAQLPDGPFIGFSLNGAIRLAVEPPVRPEDTLPDAAALAEETELGSVFMRQQFRGAQITRTCVVSSDEGYPDLEAALGARLNVPITRLTLPNLSAGAVAAFGALLDARSARPLSLAGWLAERRSGQSAPTLQLLATATLMVAAIVGIWTMSEALMARRAAEFLRVAHRRIDLESSSFAPARETAARRKLIRDAVAALQVAERDRATLRRGLASIASAVSGAVTVDSILMERGPSGWLATMGGSVVGPTSGLAVQSLSGFYRDLPRLALVESLALKTLTYADTTGGSLVHFEITFGVTARPRN